MTGCSLQLPLSAKGREKPEPSERSPLTPAPLPPKRGRGERDIRCENRWDVLATNPSPISRSEASPRGIQPRSKRKGRVQRPAHQTRVANGRIAVLCFKLLPPLIQLAISQARNDVVQFLERDEAAAVRQLEPSIASANSMASGLHETRAS